LLHEQSDEGVFSGGLSAKASRFQCRRRRKDNYSSYFTTQTHKKFACVTIFLFFLVFFDLVSHENLCYSENKKDEDYSVRTSEELLFNLNHLYYESRNLACFIGEFQPGEGNAAGYFSKEKNDIIIKICGKIWIKHVFSMKHDIKDIDVDLLSSGNEINKGYRELKKKESCHLFIIAEIVKNEVDIKNMKFLTEVSKTHIKYIVEAVEYLEANNKVLYVNHESANEIRDEILKSGNQFLIGSMYSIVDKKIPFEEYCKIAATELRGYFQFRSIMRFIWRLEEEELNIIVKKIVGSSVEGCELEGLLRAMDALKGVKRNTVVLALNCIEKKWGNKLLGKSKEIYTKIKNHVSETR